MSYSPTNLEMYNAAFTGAMGGMLASNRVPLDDDPTSYATRMAMIDAWAQSFDQAWNNAAAANALDVYAATELSQSEWENRAPNPSAANILSDTYDERTAALVAMILAGEARYLAQGIAPPGAGGTLDGDVIGPSNANIVESLTGVASEVLIIATTLSWSEPLAVAGSLLRQRNHADDGWLDTILAQYDDEGVQSLLIIGGASAGAVGVYDDVYLKSSGDLNLQSGSHQIIMTAANGGETTIGDGSAGIDLSSDPGFEVIGLTSSKNIIASAVGEIQLSCAKLTFSAPSQDTVGAAGAAAALPAAPTHYLQISTNDGDFVIPVFARA